MRILGIDPGLLTTGFGVIDAEGAELRYVASGTISTAQVASRLLPQRLKVLFDGIGEVVKRYEVSEYTALQMKKAVVGHGKAAKPQVQEMVRRLLALPGLPGTDAADALGLAIVHAQVSRSTRSIAQVTGLNARVSAAYKAGRSY